MDSEASPASVRTQEGLRRARDASDIFCRAERHQSQRSRSPRSGLYSAQGNDADPGTGVTVENEEIPHETSNGAAGPDCPPADTGPVGGRCVGSSGWRKLERQPRLAELLRAGLAEHLAHESQSVEHTPVELSAAGAAALWVGGGAGGGARRPPPRRADRGAFLRV